MAGERITVGPGEVCPGCGMEHGTISFACDPPLVVHAWQPSGDLPCIRKGACTHGWLRRRSQVWPYASGCLLDVRSGMGCLCDRDEGHAGRCRCACGSTSTTRREEVSDG